jgi:acyl carrier protein
MNVDQRVVLDRVLEIVRTALSSGAVKATDNIFDAGGDSLIFLEICAEIETEFGIEVPLDPAWAAPTVADLAKLVRECEPVGGERG